MRALIVDDSAAARAIAFEVLEQACLDLNLEMTIDTVAGGVPALRELSRGDVSLLLCDLHMPDLHGLEVLGFWVKNKVVDSRAFIVTTKVSERDKEKALTIGATAFLEKPLRREAIVKELEWLKAKQK